MKASDAQETDFIWMGYHIELSHFSISHTHTHTHTFIADLVTVFIAG